MRLFSANNNEPSIRPGSLRAATVQQGRVPYGEESRVYRRTIYQHDDWVKHRNSEGRLISNLRGMFFSGIVRQLKEEVSLISGIGLVVVLWNSLLLRLPKLCIPPLPFTLSSPALGLLLVFRTNSSYARWSEARSTWARMTAQASNVVRMAATFCDQSDEKTLPALERLSHASWLVCRSIMNQLSDPKDDAAFQDELLGAKEDATTRRRNDRILQAPDRTMAALMEASLAVDGLPIDDKKRIEIDKGLLILGDCATTCHKIYTSPVPLVYTRHASRFLSLWMLLLPTALYESFAQRTASTIVLPMLKGIGLIPAVAVVSLFLFGIEELSLQLEEPFSILPMQSFCDNVQQSTADIVSYCAKARQEE